MLVNKIWQGMTHGTRKSLIPVSGLQAHISRGSVLPLCGQSWETGTITIFVGIIMFPLIQTKQSPSSHFFTSVFFFLLNDMNDPRLIN